MIDLICGLFLMFMIYSVLGYIVEVASVSLKEHKLVYNRGFLLGPYLPIYGVSALFMDIAFSGKNINIGSLFIQCAVICTIIEFLTSYVMEKIFKVRWWDYSDRRMNIEGRVCLENSCLFGLGGIAVVYIFSPIVNKFLLNMDSQVLHVSAIILAIIFLTDLVVSVMTLDKIRNNLKKMSGARDATQDVKNAVLKTLKSNMLTKRTLKAYPKFLKEYRTRMDNLRKDIRKDIKTDLEEVKEKIKEKKDMDK